MDELKQLLNDYIVSVPGILGIILSDKEGIPIIRYKYDFFKVFFLIAIDQSRYMAFPGSINIRLYKLQQQK